MTRKNIQDEDGTIIIKNLLKNKGLERLELEGNNLGPKTLAQIA